LGKRVLLVQAQRHGVPRRSGNISLFWQLSIGVVVALGCHQAGGADKNIIGQAGGQANDIWARRVRDTM